MEEQSIYAAPQDYILDTVKDPENLEVEQDIIGPVEEFDSIQPNIFNKFTIQASPEEPAATPASEAKETPELEDLYNKIEAISNDLAQYGTTVDYEMLELAFKAAHTEDFDTFDPVSLKLTINKWLGRDPKPVQESMQKNEAGKCTWQAWQKDKKYASSTELSYGELVDDYGEFSVYSEEEKNKIIAAGFTDEDQTEVIFPAGSVFTVKEVNGPSGWPVVEFEKLPGMEFDLAFDDDDETLFTIVESLQKNEDKLDKLKKIEKEITAKIDKLYADDPDTKELISVESDVKKGHFDDGSDMYYIRLKAELGYDEMHNLSDELKSILTKYDKYAYFDMEAPGNMIAVIHLDKSKKESKKNEEIKYDGYQTTDLFADFVNFVKHVAEIHGCTAEGFNEDGEYWVEIKQGEKPFKSTIYWESEHLDAPKVVSYRIQGEPFAIEYDPFKRFLGTNREVVEFIEEYIYEMTKDESLKPAKEYIDPQSAEDNGLIDYKDLKDGAEYELAEDQEYMFDESVFEDQENWTKLLEDAGCEIDQDNWVITIPEGTQVKISKDKMYDNRYSWIINGIELPIDDDSEMQGNPIYYFPVDESKQINERGGSDYGPFAKQIANAFKAEKYNKWCKLGKAFSNAGAYGEFANIIESNCLVAMSSNFPKLKAFLNKRQIATAKAILRGLYKACRYMEPNCFPDLFTQLANSTDDENFKKLADDQFEFQPWYEEDLLDSEFVEQIQDLPSQEEYEELKCIVNFILSDGYQEFVRKCQQNFDNLIYALRKIPDGGFKANKELVIDEFKSMRDEFSTEMKRVKALAKQEWPNGMHDQVWGEQFNKALLKALEQDTKYFEYSNSFRIGKAATENAIHLSFYDDEDIPRSFRIGQNDSYNGLYSVTIVSDLDHWVECFDYPNFEDDLPSEFESKSASDIPSIVEACGDLCIEIDNAWDDMQSKQKEYKAIMAEVGTTESKSESLAFSDLTVGKSYKLKEPISYGPYEDTDGFSEKDREVLSKFVDADGDVSFPAGTEFKVTRNGKGLQGIEILGVDLDVLFDDDDAMFDVLECGEACPECGKSPCECKK